MGLKCTQVDDLSRKPISSVAAQMKTGGRLLKHARYYLLLPAESHLTERLFGGVRRRIAALPSPAGSANRGSDRISVTRETGEGKLSAEAAGKAAVAAVGRSAPAEPGACGPLQTPWTGTRVDTLPLQTAWCEAESRLKMEIPN